MPYESVSEPSRGSPLISDQDHPILDYYEDLDHDGLGTGKSEQHQLGEQRPGWVDNAGDQCPLQPGPPKNAGCPPPPDPSYYDDVDHDGLGAGPPHPEGKQLPGWVDNNRDQCPVEPGLSKIDGCPAPLVDPPRVDPPVVDPPVVDPPPVDPKGDDANEPAETGSEISDETSPPGEEPAE